MMLLNRMIFAVRARTRSLGCLLACVLVVCGGYAAHATIVLSLSERDMIKRAHLIVEAQVISQRTLRAGQAKRIVTDSVLRVQHFLKGRMASRLVTVRTMGGTLGQQSAGVSGESQLVKGKRALLFLTPATPSAADRAPTYYYVVGMSHGLYHIFQHPQTRREHAVKQSSLPAQLHLDVGGRWRLKHRYMSVASTPLTTLKQRISKSLQAAQPAQTQRSMQRQTPPASPKPKAPRPTPQRAAGGAR